MDLKQLLAKKLKRKELSILSKSFETVGGIAIIQIPPDLSAKERVIAKAILDNNKHIHTVVKKKGKTAGAYRLKQLRIIAGQKTFKTIHKENGCVFEVDLGKAYYSARLQNERLRIIKQVKPGEVIFDMFCGVGPFSIQIAKHTKAELIRAIDHNPYAIELLKKNIKKNKVTNVLPYEGDAALLINKMGVADRIIMNAPRQVTQEHLDAAREHCRGIIHLYIDSERIKDIDFITGFKILNTRTVTEYAPGKKHEVIDLQVTS